MNKQKSLKEIINYNFLSEIINQKIYQKYYKIVKIGNIVVMGNCLHINRYHVLLN